MGWAGSFLLWHCEPPPEDHRPMIPPGSGTPIQRTVGQDFRNVWEWWLARPGESEPTDA